MGSAPGQAHWPPPQAGATSGRWPSVPGVTHLIARAQMGPIRTPGGPPNPRGRVPHQRRSRALVTPPPPVGPCSPAFIPRGPGPLLCPLAPALSRLPLLPVPAPACWCPWLLALCFFFIFFFCLLAALALSAGGRRRRRRGGGGVLAVLPFAQARRKHGAGTRLGTCPSAGGGGGCRVAPVVTLPFLRLHPRRSPRGGLHGACPPWARSSRPSVSPPRRGVPGGGGPPLATVIPLVPSPSPRCPRLCPWWVREVGARGGGVRPRCPSSGVSTSQARHWHAARHLSSCWGVRHAAWPLPLPCPRCVLSPGAPPAGEGGPLPALPFPQPPPLGGRRLVGGGGALSFFCRCPRVVGTRRGFRPSAGGGGLASRLPPSPLLSYARTPVGPPAGACTERALYGHGRVARLALSFLCLPTLPRRPRGGGGALFAPSLPAFALGGVVVVGGVGRPFRLPSVARTSQACRRHSTTTGRGTWLPRGGGGFPLGLPALLHGKGPALQDHQPLLPPRR